MGIQDAIVDFKVCSRICVFAHVCACVYVCICVCARLRDVPAVILIIVWVWLRFQRPRYVLDGCSLMKRFGLGQGFVRSFGWGKGLCRCPCVGDFCAG